MKKAILVLILTITSLFCFKFYTKIKRARASKPLFVLKDCTCKDYIRLKNQYNFDFVLVDQNGNLCIRKCK